MSCSRNRNYFETRTVQIRTDETRIVQEFAVVYTLDGQYYMAVDGGTVTGMQ